MRVTVVIPSYNHAAYVEKAIRSVLAQSYPDCELIVIDDGSTDDSPKRIAELHARENGRFTFISRTNRGLIHTLQEGLDLATGEFFCELASDDYLPHDSVQCRLDGLMARPEWVAVYGEGLTVNEDTETDKTITGPRRKRIFQQQTRFVTC